MPDEVNQPTPPTVQNRASKPSGVLPRNTQTWVIIGLATVMIAAIAFSGGPAPAERTPPVVAKGPNAVDPNQARINDYRNRIDEQARRLAAEQAQLMQAKQTAGAVPPPVGGAQSGGPPAYTGYPPSSAGSYVPEPRPDRNDLKAEKEKREYLSLFASNVALTYRPDVQKATTDGIGSQVGPVSAPGVVPYLPVPATVVQAPPVVEPAKAERHARIEEGQEEQTPEQDRHRKSADYTDLNRSGGKPYRLFEGTVLEAVLTNRLNGSFSGPVNCMVTTAVYSHDRQRLLIPKGSRVLGEAKRVENFGQQRLAVSFHRIIMPNGYSVSLDEFQGLNQIGETGLRDKVNRHYVQVFGASLAIGAIAGLAQANTRYGFDMSGTDAYRQGVASSLAQSSMRILDRYLNILPTFVIREGHRVKIYLADDLLLPEYGQHQLPEDL